MLFERSPKTGEQKAEEASELPIPTRSVCPECSKIVDAQLYDRQGQVWMHKACDEHGSFNELISSDKEFFLQRRRRHFELGSPMHNPHSQSQANCPHDCGICNQHKSSPCLVNIDLTNRCNLNCPICFANANASGRLFEMSLDQLGDILDRVMGIEPYPPLSVQYAGGEPTVHPRFLEAVKMAKDKGVLDLQGASNGLLFGKEPDFPKRAA
ncbi:MAG: radical SAM protein, partial [Desulfohalobiaceae bacterium]|nr:radical SAM protein [Desulfohalobiaceae bacterium]